ncbi:hypothetical protein [Actinomycetospora atypica]|uniref:Secreted protein n=1 Tax=Actinomycetospora atypica TaxID=1290095 RepID=A0ABV9YPE1_9PSEU
MSTFRKTVLTTAIIGAGLAATTGSAFASDCGHDNGHEHKSSHGHSKTVTNNNGCSNEAGGSIDNGGAKNLIGALNGSQGALGLNVCDNLNGNKILSDNDISILGGTLPGLPI